MNVKEQVKYLKTVVMGAGILGTKGYAALYYVLEELRAAKKREREIWKAICPACDNYRDNGAGIACIERDFKPPTFSGCPLLKGMKR
jgi:hypothetical protein